MAESDGGGTNNIEENGGSICQPGQETTGRWSSEEHEQFLAGLERYEKTWKLIATMIPTRTVVQIRTHAQKHFQKIEKARNSSNRPRDPAMLMSTMHSAKLRPASVILPSNGVVDMDTMEEKVRSLPKRKNRGKRARQLGSDDESESNPRGSSNSSSSSMGRARQLASSDTSSDQEDDHDVEGDGTGHLQHAMMRAQSLGVGKGSAVGVAWSNGDGIGGLRSIGAELDEEKAAANINDYLEGSTDDEIRSEIAADGPRRVPVSAFGYSIDRFAATTAAGTASASITSFDETLQPSRQRLTATAKTSTASSSSLAPAHGNKISNDGRYLPNQGGVGCASSHSFGWDSISSDQMSSVGNRAVGVVEWNGGGGGGGGGVRKVVSTKRGRMDDRARVLMQKRGFQDGVPKGAGISPTSVADVDHMLFPVQHQQKNYSSTSGPHIPTVPTNTDGNSSDMSSTHHLPPRLSPSWCTKPQDSYTTANDAGPFRWFIDERSVSASGAFFQSPAESWGGSDSTDGCTSTGVSSNGEGNDIEPGRADIDVVTNVTSYCSADMSSASAVVGVVDGTGRPVKQWHAESVETAVPPPNVHQAPSSFTVADGAGSDDAAVGGLDIASGDIGSGLWSNFPQEVVSPAGLGPGVNDRLSLGSFNADDMIGFLACDDPRSPAVGNILAFADD